MSMPFRVVANASLLALTVTLISGCAQEGRRSQPLEPRAGAIRMQPAAVTTASGESRSPIVVGMAATVQAPATVAPTRRQAAPGQDPFLEAYAATFRFRLGIPREVKPLPDGSGVIFLRSGPRDFVHDLYLFDVATGSERVLMTAADILGGGTETLSAEEAARRERQRVAARGIASYSLAEDGSRVLVPLAGRLFVVDMDTERVREVTGASGDILDPRFMPGAASVCYVRNGNLCVADVATGTEVTLTWSGSPEVTNGLAEFVAQEEMDRDEGYWWSPDAQRVLYQRTDTSGLERMYIMDPGDPTQPPRDWPYPRPGQPNADVTLRLLDRGSGADVEVAWDRRVYPYLARVVWPESGPPTMLVQDRRQTEQQLLAIDPSSGATRVLLSERDQAWLNIDAEMPVWSRSGDRFLWTTERNNGRQLEIRRRDGSLIAEVTGRTEGYRRLADFNEDTNEVWWIGSSDPAEAQLFVSSLVEADPRRPPQRVTRVAGVHDAEFSRDHSIYVHKVATLVGTYDHIVRHRDGSIIGTINSAAESPPMPVNLEITSVGEQPWFKCAVIRPNDFDPTATYPVIVSVYGGPHAQMVQAARRNYVLQQWFADHGFIVVCIDGRGTPNRGRLWERAIKNDLISLPLEDQVAGLRRLGERYPEMDLEHVGIYGWSFGGYFSAMAVMRRPDIFDAGIAGAPVCDWLDYDTHYTERYLGLPDENPEGYRTGNVITWASQLTRPLLIIHGTADDNVFFTHSLQMSGELTRQGIAHEFLPLPGMTHMVTDPRTTVAIYERMRDFFLTNLERE
ncbi:MAG: DPP IV N-terminal domain-containing protein [Phycisphaerales bacterium]|nr:DPP IV N-terminal domain-containing protein [Phycisphaerales bacterium]